MKRVITHGCSFTKYKWSCWPEFLSWFEQDIDVKIMDFQQVEMKLLHVELLIQ